MDASEGPFKVFIGNLPFDGVQGDIEQILRHVGFTNDQIHSFRIRMIRDRETDKFKGFAYVEFNSADEQNKVLELNGVEYGGRPLKIDVATQRSGGDRGSRKGARGGGGGWTTVNQHDRRGHSSNFRDGNSVRSRQRRLEQNDEDSGIVEHPERPRLVLKPRTTDPAELEAKQKREAEEEAARRAKLFIA
uniref:RRM domain-containing protein n=1 Tax=Angiostrongylus cantonensis TaxID=6313 RepID=A0A0K0DG33_ANGCA